VRPLPVWSHVTHLLSPGSRAGRVVSASPSVAPMSGAILAFVVVIAAMTAILLLGFLMWVDYRHEVETAEAMTRNYAAILEARLEATFRRLETDLDELAARVPLAALNAEAAPRYEAAVHHILAQHLRNFPEVSGLRVTDASGERLYTSDPPGTPRSWLGDRAYFKAVRDDPAARLVFSEVLVGRVTGRNIVVVIRAIRDAQDVFRGTVFATVDLAHMEKLFQSLRVGARASFALWRSDNYTQVLRWPPSPDRVNVPLPEGSPVRAALSSGVRPATLEVRSFADGVTRIYALYKLERYPFFVGSGVSRDDTMEGWTKRALFVAIAALFVGGLVFGLLHRLWRAEGELLQFNVELEERVRARTADLENANRELEAFSYSISHDLRTPLRSIASYSRMVELDYAECLDAQGRKMLQRVHEAAKKMGVLIEDLLRLSRVTRAQMKIEAVSVTELAAGIAHELQRQEPGRNATFKIQPDMAARADPGLVAVALENLIGNAWKFASTRPVPYIEVGTVETGGDTVYFVRDNGVGFDMGYVGNLFAPFHRLHGEREFPGTGIGLATVKRIVERHGGRIWADAAVDLGATFYFTLGRQGGDHG